ncbi:MAG: hypothetical protein LQ343_006905 [Gyalolechia ehrenbergii]|nr:MAG: hypothetical protein LQ343_006905 [Gyalolechia ehrenbergii]
MYQSTLVRSRPSTRVSGLCLHGSRIPVIIGPGGLEHGRRNHVNGSSLPRVARPSLWQSIVPKFMRPSDQLQTPGTPKSPKEWNPATFFIVMFLLIGSNAMQMIALRNEFTAFSRRADEKIALLKEVIGRVQGGEEVDVKGLLGTGDPEKEKEWEQGQCLSMKVPSSRVADLCHCSAIQDIVKQDRLWQSRARQRSQKETSKPTEPKEQKSEPDSELLPASKTTPSLFEHNKEATPVTTRKVPRAFY